MVNPDSNPTLSLSVYMFFGPALLWIGATLLLVRLRGRGLAWLARRASRAQPRVAGLVPAGERRAAAGRRSTAGWSWSGCCSPSASASAIFSATYDQQARVDAQLTLGADVTVSAPPGTWRQAAPAGEGRPGTRASRRPPRVDHSYAYVGPDLQDTFGIDPSSFPKATSLRDSYFLGGTASQMMSRLAADAATGSWFRSRRSPTTR